MAGSNFVDYVKIFARSGHGGAGSAHFRREKFVAFGGPDGGDGGKGGSIILKGDSQYWTLIHLKYQRHQFAEDGQCGSGARSSGKDAKDIVIPVPLGTVARRVVETEEGETELQYVGEVTADGEELVLLKGGRGGLGNWHFKTATNQAPRYAQPGEEGDEGAFILELKVLADVEILVPSYGFCAIPPAEEFADSVCEEFFSLPLFPAASACNNGHVSAQNIGCTCNSNCRCGQHSCGCR